MENQADIAPILPEMEPDMILKDEIPKYKQEIGTSSQFSRDDFNEMSEISSATLPIINMLSSVTAVKNEKGSYEIGFKSDSQVANLVVIGNVYDMFLHGKTNNFDFGKKTEKQISEFVRKFAKDFPEKKIQTSNMEIMKTVNTMTKLIEKINSIDKTIDSLSAEFKAMNKEEPRKFNNVYDSIFSGKLKFDEIELQVYAITRIGYLIGKRYEICTTKYGGEFSEFVLEFLCGIHIYCEFLNKYTANLTNMSINVAQLRANLSTTEKEIKDTVEKRIRKSEDATVRNSKIDLTDILTKYPKLLFKNSMSNFIPTGSLAPFDHQRELLKLLMNNLSQGFLLKYLVMAGYGKTSLATAIATLLPTMEQETKKKHVLIYGCNIDPARKEVCKYFLHSGIIFASVAKSSCGRKCSVRKHPSYKTRNENEIQAYVCGPEFVLCALEIVKKIGATPILLLDEVTVGADNAKSKELLFNSEILANLPKHTILCTATLPNDDDISCVIEIYKTANPDALISSVTSSYIKLGCSTLTSDQVDMFPFSGIKTVTQLKQLVPNIRNNGFLKRMCTFRALKLLNNRLINKSSDLSFDWAAWIQNINNIDQNVIAEKVISILDDIVNYQIFSDVDIEEICKRPVNQTAKPNEIVMSNFAQNCHVFNGMTLIASNDPMLFVKTNLGSFIENIKKNFDLETTAEQYDAENEKYLILASEFEKRKTEAEQKERENKKEQSKSKKSGDERNGTQKSSINTLVPPSEPNFSFPRVLRVNSTEFIKKNNSTVNKKVFQEFFPTGFETHGNGKTQTKLMKMSKPEELDLTLLLLSGIAVISETITNKTYNFFAKKFASEGKLSFVIADHTISFGTNFPFSSVFVEDDFANNHSMETIMQVIARAGRLGLVYEATAYLPKSHQFTGRFLEYALGNAPTRFNEGENISRTVSEFHANKVGDVAATEVAKVDTVPKVAKVAKVAKVEEVSQITEIEEVAQVAEVPDDWENWNLEPVHDFDTVAVTCRAHVFDTVTSHVQTQDSNCQNDIDCDKSHWDSMYEAINKNQKTQPKTSRVTSFEMNRTIMGSMRSNQTESTFPTRNTFGSFRETSEIRKTSGNRETREFFGSQTQSFQQQPSVETTPSSNKYQPKRSLGIAFK